MRNNIHQIVKLVLAALLTISTAYARIGAVRHAKPCRRFGGTRPRPTASVKTKAKAEARFRQIRRSAPSDARVPYAYALLLIERKRYQDASKPLDDALRLDGGNLSAWKTRIWLSVLTGDHDDALATMERRPNGCRLRPRRRGVNGSAESSRGSWVRSSAICRARARSTWTR